MIINQCIQKEQVGRLSAVGYKGLRRLGFGYRRLLAEAVAATDVKNDRRLVVEAKGL